MTRPLFFGDILFLLRATGWTILLFIASSAGGAFLGGILTLFGLSTVRPVRLFAALYVKVIQGTPVLMQLFLIYFGGDMFGFPIPGFLAAVLALSINAAAFLTEIWRSAILSVPKGQWEAAKVLGLSYRSQLVDVVSPQALRVAIPPTVGFAVHMIKITALASLVGFVELTRASQLINNATFRPFLIFGVVSLIYFLLCWPISVASVRLEKRLAKAYER